MLPYFDRYVTTTHCVLLFFVSTWFANMYVLKLNQSSFSLRTIDTAWYSDQKREETTFENMYPQNLKNIQTQDGRYHFLK